MCAVIKKNRDMRLVTDKSLNLSFCLMSNFVRMLKASVIVFTTNAKCPF